MESFRTALAGIFLLFSLATAQFTPGAKPVCPEPQATGGYDYMSHEKYGEMFYRCPGGNLTAFKCGENTLYDYTMNQCNHLYAAMSEYWGDCTPAKYGTKYPHTCPDKFYTCTEKRYVIGNCPSGQSFETTTGNCVNGVTTDPPECTRAVRNDSATCIHKADEFGDVCKFQTVDGNTTWKDRSCSDNTAFNQTACGCTIKDTNCPKPTTKSMNKLPDNMCRSSFELSFELTFPDTGRLRAYSRKISAQLNDTIQETGATYNGGIATLSSTAQTPAQLYVYAFNYNELTRNTGLAITFRFTAATSTPVYLITNNFNGACMPTINVTATFSGNTYTVTATGIFMNRYSTSNTTYMADTITLSLQVAQPNSFVEVKLIHDTMMRGKITDKGTTGTTSGQVVNRDGTVYLGSSPTYSYNKCGLTIGRGLTGDIAEFSLYEGCRDNTIFMG